MSRFFACCRPTKKGSSSSRSLPHFSSVQLPASCEENLNFLHHKKETSEVQIKEQALSEFLDSCSLGSFENLVSLVHCDSAELARFNPMINSILEQYDHKMWHDQVLKAIFQLLLMIQIGQREVFNASTQQAFLSCLSEVKTVPVTYNAFCLVIGMIQPSFEATEKQFNKKHSLLTIVPLSSIESSTSLSS